MRAPNLTARLRRGIPAQNHSSMGLFVCAGLAFEGGGGVFMYTYMVESLVFRVWGLRVRCSGFMVWSRVLRVNGLELGVEGLRFGVGC